MINFVTRYIPQVADGDMRTISSECVQYKLSFQNSTLLSTMTQ